MRVIFNADDFGFSKGVNYGILEAYEKGPVRSVTMMANMPGFGHGVQLAHENPGLKVGVHLVLTAGYSVGGPYGTITDHTGKFLRAAELLRRAEAQEICLDEVEAEYEAQIQKIMHAGIWPTHFDGHHHAHNLPGVVDVFLKLAKQYGVAVRIHDKTLLTGAYAGIKTTAAFSQDFYDAGVTMENLKQIILSGGNELEVMCHPAYVDPWLWQTASYNTRRVDELIILTSEELRGFMEEQGIVPCSFADIWG